MAGLTAAAGAVRAGQLVVLPTDTVYGLGCEAFSSTAVQNLLDAKGRGRDMLRMPLHPVALELLREVGPMAVSSANRSGHPPATTVEQAREQLAERVPVYLDGGTVGEPLASTIVDLTADDPVVLREGVVTAAQIGEVLGLTIKVAR
jgi:tRNA A37 threonylcarbamoyladenosine synthetase subunit TsaC/SUA5/YrdC